MTIMMMERLPQEDAADRKRRAGQWLKAQRETRGMSARKLARAMGIDSAVISNYERGVSAIGDERAYQLATVLRLPVRTVRAAVGLWVPDDEGDPHNVITDIDSRPWPEETKESVKRVIADLDRMYGAVEDGDVGRLA